MTLRLDKAEVTAAIARYLGIEERDIKKLKVQRLKNEEVSSVVLEMDGGRLVRD